MIIFHNLQSVNFMRMLKKLLNPFAIRKEEDLNQGNEKMKSDVNDSSCDPKMLGSGLNDKSPVIGRKANTEKRDPNLVSNIAYISDSSEDKDEIYSPIINVHTIRGRTPIKRTLKLTSSSDEDTVPSPSKRRTPSTTSFNSMEAEKCYSKQRNEYELVTTSSSKSSSSEEEIDVSIPGEVQVTTKKKKNEKKISSSELSDFTTTTSTSNSFFSTYGDANSTNNKIQNDDHESVNQEENNEKNVGESENEIHESTLKENVPLNVVVNRSDEKDENKIKSCCSGLRKMKIKRLVNKKKKLTPCVIIDMIRQKSHPLYKYQHLFTHKSIEGMTEKEFKALRRTLLHWKQQRCVK